MTAVQSNAQFEKALIGAFIAEPERVAAVFDKVSEAEFSDPQYKAVFRAGRQMIQAGKVVDILTLADVLNKNNHAPSEGWSRLLTDCLDACPVWTHWERYAEELKELSRRRQLIELSQQIIQGTNDNASTADLLASVSNQIGVIQRGGISGDLPACLNAAAWALEELPDPEQILAEAVDLGTKTVIVAPSKARKSFFMLQATVSLTGGLPTFLAWNIPKPRRALFWNLEITPAHFHKRLLRMLRALDLTPASLGDRLLILNTRGMDVTASGMSQLAEILKTKGVEVVVIDPVYKLIPGDETKQDEVKRLLKSLDKLCTETGAAVLYSHHTAKGISGDRQAIDRTSGSGVLARDFDCQIGLVPHVEDGLMVVEQIVRSYPPRDAFCIGWDDTRGCFEVMDGVDPVIQTSKNRNMSGRVGPALTDDDALAVVSEKPLPSVMFREELRRRGFTERAAREIRVRLIEDGRLAEMRIKVFPQKVYVGTPEGIKQLRQEYQKPKIEGLK